MCLSLQVSNGSPTVVVATGELDLASSPEMEKCLAPLEGDLLVDCSGLTFVDARGLSVFVEAHARVGGAGGSFVLARPSPTLVRLLGILGLEELLGASDGGEQADFAQT